MANHSEELSATTAQNEDLRQTVIACLTNVCGKEPESGHVPVSAKEGEADGLPVSGLTNSGSQEQTSTQPASRAAEVRDVVECLSHVISAATADAETVATHLGHLEEHLSVIGCVQRTDVEQYFCLANSTLASLYREAAKSRPSPSEVTKLALRYSLDARHPIEGDIGRFVLRRLKNMWEVIEYPSVAMKVPSIPLPGRLVKNVFAVRILDCLQERPPAIYALMGLIESLLGGVPAETAGLAGGSTCPNAEQRARIKVDLVKFIVWLDGDPVPVSEEQAHFVQLVVSAGGTWISSREMGEDGRSGVIVGCRPDRVFKKLPSRIRDLIESGGGRGFRLRRPMA